MDNKLFIHVVLFIMILCAIFYPLYEGYRNRYAFTTETFSAEESHVMKLKMIYEGGFFAGAYKRTVQSDGSLSFEGYKVQNKEKLFISETENRKIDSADTEYQRKNPNKSFIYESMDIIGVKEGDEILLALHSSKNPTEGGILRKFACEYTFGSSREVSSVSRVPSHILINGNKNTLTVNPIITGCYRTADIANFKQARMVDSSTTKSHPFVYAKKNGYKYVLVPNRSKNTFYVMNETSSVPSNDQVCVLDNVYPQSMDDVVLFELSDRAIQMTESSIPPFVKSDKMSPETRVLSPKLAMDDVMYLFKVTVPSPNAKRKFCPDINYREFDNAGCSARLSKDACKGSLSMNYVADDSLCSTPYDYKSNDPFKNYNDFTLLSQMILKDYQVPFRSSVRSPHPPETFGKQLELLLKTAMTVATATGYVVSADSMDSETRLPLLNSPSYFGIIQNALNHINNPMTQPSPLTEQFQQQYKTVLMKLRSFRDADEFNKLVVMKSGTKRPVIGGSDEDESSGISMGVRA